VQERVQITCCPSETLRLRELLSRTRPDWLLIGDMADEATERLAACAKATSPLTRLAMLGPEDDMQRCQRWMRRGCSVYLDRDSGLKRVASALLAATDSDLLVYSRTLYLHMRQVHDPLAYPALTSRQQEVLDLLSRGLSNSEIGSLLHVTQHTVEFHMRTLLSKFHARNRLEVVRRAADIGLVA
jgi:DNA-binding NarL/FixJ family response regulator